MRSISIQVQPELSPGVDMDALTTEFEAIASRSDLVAHHSFGSGNDRGVYFNYTFDTLKPLALWQAILAKIYEGQETGSHMKRASMAMCSEDDGWDDYLQLFHYDSSVQLDSTDALKD
ncbi:MAG: hypothetical protein K0U72_03055 [Gammaproteobacteria bacterium]|nr:hypothetical protein [Gammaproteobacteria bacterium]